MKNSSREDKLIFPGIKSSHSYSRILVTSRPLRSKVESYNLFLGGAAASF